MTSQLGIDQARRLIGNYKWVEMRLFEVLGGWIQTVPELDAKLLLARHCYRHAWHAEQWHKVQPRLGPDDRDLTVAANEHVEAFIRALCHPQGAEATAEKLVGVYRVLLPHTIAGYRSHLGRVSGITDGPIVRCLELALADEQAACREGETLIETLIGSEEELRAATNHQGALEAIMRRAGGIAGALDGLGGRRP